jgi:hypothetical protein
MKVKVVEGVWGNRIAADYRRSHLPAKICRELAFWFLTLLLVLSIAVFGFVVGISLLGD